MADLSTAEKDWVETVVGGVDAVDAALLLQQRKEALLAESRQVIESKVGEISVGEDFLVEMKGSAVGDFIRKQLDLRLVISSVRDEGDANLELDTEHDMPDVKGMRPDDFKRLIEAQAIIAGEVGKLQLAFDTATRQKLFTDREISDAIWAPLMRRKLVPENAIPSRYSEVSRTFDGASEAYQERLAAYTDGLGKFEKLCEKLGLAKDFVDAIATTALATVSDLTAAGVSNFDPTVARDCITLIQVTVSGGIGATAEMLEIAGDEDMSLKMKIAKCAVAICKQAGDMAGASAGVAFGTSDRGLSVGAIIKDSIRLAVLSGSAAVKLADGDYEGMLGDIADMVVAGTDIDTQNSYLPTASTTERDINADQNAVGTVTAGDIGRFVADGIKVTGAGGKFFLNAMKNKDVKLEDVAGFLGTALQMTVDAGSSWYAEQQTIVKLEEANNKDTENAKSDDEGKRKEGEDRADYKNAEMNELQEISDKQAEGANSEGFGALGEIMKQLQSKRGDELEEFLKKNPQFRNLAQTVKKQQSTVIEEANKNLDKQVMEEAKSFREMLNKGMNGDLESQARTVEAMILQIKRDQMIVDLAFKLTSMPAQVVAAFLPQAGIAVSGIELIKHLKLAAEHLMALVEWRENTGDARAAMSVQAEAMINRANLEAKHTMKATYDAITDAINIVGGALACAGHLAPAGHVLATTNKAVHAIVEVLYKFYNKKLIHDQWKLYLKALNNPEDRIVVRKAIRENPTLAKYVIAYGAEVEANPVARNAMRKCGLDAEVLDKKDTNVQKVEAYLEALYPEDPVVLAVVSRPKDWWPGPLELSSGCIAAFASAAASKPGQKLKPGAAKSLLTQVGGVETLSRDYRNLFDGWRDADALAVAKPGDKQLADEATRLLSMLSTLAFKRKSAAESLMQAVKAPDLQGADNKPHADMNEAIRSLGVPARNLVAAYRRDEQFVQSQEEALANAA